MEIHSESELRDMQAELKQHDGNQYSESSIDNDKVDHDEDLDPNMSHSSTSVVKIKEAFLNSNIDVYLLANPFSGSREAKAYTNLQSENYRFTIEEDNEVFLRICDITQRDKVKLCKEYIKTSIETKINRDASQDDRPINLKHHQIIVVI